MSISDITRVQRPISLANIERINQINANNREISALKSQIAAQKEVSATAKKLITNNSENINLTKEIITNTKEIIAIKKEMIANNESLISSGNRKIGILEQLKASSDRLIGDHQERLGLLQESRDLTKESRDLTKESRDLTKESRDLLQKMIDVVEKMIAIMVKNPAKYGGLPNTEIQKQPEVIASKSQIAQLANSKVEQYPKEERAILADTVKNVVDATFLEIKSTATDIKVGRELFYNLPKRIEAALDKKHKTLFIKDFRQIMTNHYKSVEKFSKIKKLNYLDLALKNIKA